MNTVAVVLAARAEEELGVLPALAEHEGGRTFLRSVSSILTKAGCSVLTVTGLEADRVEEWHPGAQLVTAGAWKERPGSVLHAGLAAARHGGAERMVVLPVDLPALRLSTLKTLLNQPLDAGAALRPTFEGAPGFPVILSLQAAETLLAADDHQTPEALLASLSPRTVAVKDPGVVVRIRDAQLYERLLGHPPREAAAPKRRTRKPPPGPPPSMEGETAHPHE